MELPIFLTIDEVERIHNNQIELYGGAVGYIDKKRLESAIGAVEAGMGGQYFHPTIHAMAAAYAYYLIKNHAFLDGNKRTGVAVCSIFLLMNGWDLIETFSIDIAVGVANSNVSKQELTEYILSVIRRS
jgi:death-on-curing protein